MKIDGYVCYQVITATLARRGNAALASSNVMSAPRKRVANKPLDQHPPGPTARKRATVRSAVGQRRNIIIENCILENPPIFS
jgi:hypothetical protein